MNTIKTEGMRKQPAPLHAKTPACPKRHQSKSLAGYLRKRAADACAKRRQGPSMGGRERHRRRRKEDDPRERIQSSTRGGFYFYLYVFIRTVPDKG